MKKVLFMGAVGATMLCSCSSDEVISLNRNDEIRFNVQTEMNTRAADVFCNSNMPGTFLLYASAGGNKYIYGETFNVSNGTASSTTQHYWPEGTVDFYAHVNGENSFSWGSAAATPTFTNFEVKSEPAEQLDLLYAVTKGASKPTSSGDAVNLNFRHALSQIVFRAKKSNENLKVEIYGVALCGVNGKGTYTFATTTTSGNIQDHTNSTTNDQPETTRGKWSSLSTPAHYVATLDDAVELEENNKTYNLTLAMAEDGTHGNTKGDLAMLLIPQNTDKFDIDSYTEVTEATTGDLGKVGDSQGSYFLVKCNIYDVQGEGDDTVETLLWGTEGTEGTGKYALVPADFDWKEGKKYIYTFIFGNGNGGYDPENPDPDFPVLTPITFACTVDDFIKGDNKDVEMSTEGTTTDTDNEDSEND